MLGLNIYTPPVDLFSPGGSLGRSLGNSQDIQPRLQEMFTKYN